MHRLKNWQLIAVCVLTWGTTWYAITFQLGKTAPEIAVALRFGLAGGVVLAMCKWRGIEARFTNRDHLRLALQGGFMFGLAYLCVYHAEQHVVSGLVAVGYSASPLVSGLGARVLFGTRLTMRFFAGGLLGLTGVTLIFWPEFGKTEEGSAVALGAAFTLASVLLSTVGSLTASRNRLHGMPFWPALGTSMLYGAGVSMLAALLRVPGWAAHGGLVVAPPIGWSWWVSLLYLSLAGSVLTFACYLTLQERIGPGPSGTIGVMTPLLALLVSMAFESFRPDALTFVGAALAVLGNVWMLRQPAPPVVKRGVAAVE